MFFFSRGTNHPSSVALKTVASPNANAYLAITNKLVFLTLRRVDESLTLFDYISEQKPEGKEIRS